MQKNSEPVQKITIVPRTMGALGYVMQVPEEEKYLNSKAELEAIIIGLLGGRAAEELKFESVTTGASNDIERATALARNMVTQYGMSERFGLMGLATVESQYLEGRAVLNCSDVTAAAVDEEVRKILESSYQEAKRILSENMDAMDVIADFLIKQETITGKEFMKMFNDVRAQRDGGQALLTDQQTEDKAGQAAAAEEASKTEETAAAETPAEPVKSAEEAASRETEESAAAEPSAEMEAAEAPAEPVKSAEAAEAPAEPGESAEETEPLETEQAAEAEKSAQEQAPAETEVTAEEQASTETEVTAEEQVPAETEESTENADGLSPEELVRRTNSPRGRYSHVSADDIFGEE